MTLGQLWRRKTIPAPHVELVLAWLLLAVAVVPLVVLPWHTEAKPQVVQPPALAAARLGDDEAGGRGLVLAQRVQAQHLLEVLLAVRHLVVERLRDLLVLRVQVLESGELFDQHRVAGRSLRCSRLAEGEAAACRDRAERVRRELVVAGLQPSELPRDVGVWARFASLQPDLQLAQGSSSPK